MEEKIYIGVDLGGTTIKLGLVMNDQLVAHTKIASEADKSFASKLSQIEEAVEGLLRANNYPDSRLGGIGLAFPSIVDSRNKRILSRYVKFTDADQIDLTQWARDSWGIPLALENDAKAALLGEWKFGAGKGKSYVAMLTLGTGVGSAVIMDGKLLRGAHFLAGNLGGHTIINYLGADCNCGSRGCVETEASGWVLAEKFRDYPGLADSSLANVSFDFKAIFSGAANGDKVAISIRDKCLEAWAAAAVNIVHSFDPEVIIFGGGIMNSKDQILPFIQKKVDEYCWLPEGSVRMVPAIQIEHAGILGMGYAAAQEPRPV